MSESILLGVISALWLIVVGVSGYEFKRIHEKLDNLAVHQTGCLRMFADRERNDAAHREFYRRTDDLDRRVTRLEDRERKG